MPGEVLPLVSAINLHMARFAAQARVQSQFLDDASHQLRTPLSVLRTQTAYALRETDPRRSVQPFWRCRKAWTGPCVPPTRCWPWRALKTPPWPKAGSRPSRSTWPSDAVIRTLLPAARTRQLDVGMDRPDRSRCGGRLAVAGGGQQPGGQRHPLQPAGRGPDGPGAGRGRTAWLVVEDSGPGMSAEDIARACVRFRRERRAEQAGRRPGPGHRRHHRRDPGREAGPGEPDAAAGLRAALVFTLKTPRMLPRHENHRI